jgi:DNA polymerase III sliding clamp (beta) subunit (PCNA family)
MVSALGTLNKAFAKQRSSLPVLNHVNIQVGAEGFTLTRTDLDMMVIVKCPATVQDDWRGDFCVPAQKMEQVITSMPGDTVEMEMERLTVRFRSEKYYVEMRILPGDEFPSQTAAYETDGIHFQVAADVLHQSLSRVSPAVGNASEISKNGVWFSFRNSKLNLYATDGRHCHAENNVLSSLDAANNDMLIREDRVKAFQIALALASGDVELIVSDTFIVLRTVDVTVASRGMQLGMPGFDKILAQGHVPDSLHVDPAVLAAALKRVMLIAPVDKPKVRLAVVRGDNYLSLTCKNDNVGDAIERVPIKWQEGNDYTIVLNAAYLLEAVRVVDKLKMVKIDRSDQETVHISADDYHAVIASIRQ